MKIIAKTKIVLLSFVLLLGACTNDSTDSNNQNAITADSFDFLSMFANIADNIIITNYQALATAAASYAADNSPLDSYCNAIGTAGETAAADAAQAAWRELMNSWQQTELHLLGPITDNNNALANRINSFSSANISTCGIDQAVVLAETASFTISSRSSNQRGLGAIGYLLFNTDLTHTCPSQITETTNWNSRPSQERQQLRCNLAKIIADDISTAATEVLAAWQRDNGNYRSTFINPDNFSTNLPLLSDALFYLDTDVKDVKLGIPTGLNNGCSQLSCPDDVESPYSQHSLINIQNNLQAFLTIFNGANGLGFDDIIQQAGFTEVATRFNQQTQNAIDFIDSINTSLLTQTRNITSNTEAAECSNAFANPDSPSNFPACNLLGHIKAITDDLKTDFITIVNVDLPDRAQSDND